MGKDSSQISLNLENLDAIIQNYMSRIADVNLEGMISSKDYVVAFRNAFGIDKHNGLEKNDKGILCYDLMICQNPLEKEQKQLFYTFFSQKEVYAHKVLLADVYEYYLKNYQGLHVDTMLQIAYSEKEKGTNREKVKDGFFLEFTDDGLKFRTLENKFATLSSFAIEKEIRNKHKKYIKEKAKHYKQLIKPESELTEEEKAGKEKVIEQVFKHIENDIQKLPSICQEEECVTKFGSFVDAFLGEKMPYIDDNKGIDQIAICQNAYRIHLINELAVPGIKRLFFIPVSFPGGKQIGHFVMSTKGDHSLDEEKTIIDKFRVLSFVMLFPLSQINLSSHYIEKARADSIKSAKAAIMSRNMSHNLGSHVMFYIKQRLESVEKIMETGALKELINLRSVEELQKVMQNKAVPGEEMPFLVGLGRFLNYLQERQDFIATVATNYIPYRTTINFKDAIYDELKPEKHALRHNGDAIGRKAANLLLDYIAYSEGFTSSDFIDLWFGDSFNGGTEPGDVPADLREFNVALPGGNLGRQAFFSIMENIIRNTAKHDGHYAVNGKLQFQFDRLSAESIKQGPAIQGYSLRSGEDSGEKMIEDISSGNRLFDASCYTAYENIFHYLGITIKLSKPVEEGTLKDLSKDLARDYLTFDGLMDEECKGLKEIRISAAWLRGQELDNRVPSCEPPAVAIRKTKDGHLQYIICLPKPKKVACIVSTEKWNRLNYNLLEKGVEFFKFDSINDTLIKEMANYEIVAVDKDKEVPQSLFELLQKNVGSRIFRTTMDAPFSPNQAYSEWLRDTFDLKETDIPAISILDGESKNDCLNPNEKVRESGTSERREGYFDNAIVYIRHYSGQPSYRESARRVFKKACFIEAVSGGNTTYRLVRQDRRDEEWYVKIVATGLSKVAIFDERIYGMIMPEGEFEEWTVRTVVNNFFQQNALSNYKQQNIENTFKLFCKSVLIENLKVNSQLARGPIYDELKEIKLGSSYRVNSAKVIKVLSKYISIKEYSKTWKYREAGVWAFNIKVESDSVILIGYNAPVTKQIGPFSGKYKEIELAVIRKKGDKIKIEKLQMPKRGYKFDFISIHQGILDKIYSTLKLDKSEKGKTEREILTSELYNMFSKLSSKKTCDNYLPQFIIHSGRSKPNIEDMPQKQPFLQFSALDHALRDCKYTLVELLNSAHYEESDNHN